MKNKIIEFWKTGENPITCFRSRKNNNVFPKVSLNIVLEKSKKKQEVLFISSVGERKKYESIIEASIELNIPPNTVYAILNGRLKNKTGYAIQKI